MRVLLCTLLFAMTIYFSGCAANEENCPDTVRCLSREDLSVKVDVNSARLVQEPIVQIVSPSNLNVLVQIDVPRVHELVNIAIALTEVGKRDRDLIYQDTDYYAQVLTAFSSHLDHELITNINNTIDGSINSYIALKLNASTFHFDSDGQIVKNRDYGSIRALVNPIDPILDILQDFSRTTRYLEFYDRHRQIYERQADYFIAQANIPEMVAWLQNEFPAVSPYDQVRLVFSPLVNAYQHQDVVEKRKARELLIHTNYPYVTSQAYQLGPIASAVWRARNVFTELNHGYINSLAVEHSAKISSALEDRSNWVDDSKSARNYNSAASVFSEYLNWALLILYCDARGPSEDTKLLNNIVGRYMRDGRGFTKFPEFSQYLRSIYNPAAGLTVLDLYPDLIAWFEHN